MYKKTAPGCHLCKSDENAAEAMRMMEPGYGILYQIGSGLGAEIEQLLELDVKDVREKDHLSMRIGPLRIRRTWNFPEEFRKELDDYIGNRNDKLFVLRDGSEMTKEQTEKALKSCGIGKSFLQILMRCYYDETGDPYYPQHMMMLPSEDAVMKDLYTE